MIRWLRRWHRQRMIAKERKANEKVIKSIFGSMENYADVKLRVKESNLLPRSSYDQEKETVWQGLRAIPRHKSNFVVFYTRTGNYFHFGNH